MVRSDRTPGPHDEATRRRIAQYSRYLPISPQTGTEEGRRDPWPGFLPLPAGGIGFGGLTAPHRPQASEFQRAKAGCQNRREDHSAAPSAHQAEDTGRRESFFASRSPDSATAG